MKKYGFCMESQSKGKCYDNPFGCKPSQTLSNDSISEYEIIGDTLPINEGILGVRFSIILININFSLIKFAIFAIKQFLKLMSNKYTIICLKFKSSETKSSGTFNPFKYYYPGCSGNFFDKCGIICPICLCILSPIKGRPNKCNHLYCYLCIQKWFKTSNFSPMNRRKFSYLIKIR